MESGAAAASTSQCALKLCPNERMLIQTSCSSGNKLKQCAQVLHAHLHIGDFPVLSRSTGAILADCRCILRTQLHVLHESPQQCVRCRIIHEQRPSLASSGSHSAPYSLFLFQLLEAALAC